MAYQNRTNSNKRIMHSILLAGLLGGTAEVAWVAVYGIWTDSNSIEVLRQITGSIFPSMTQSNFSPYLGLCIHFLLAIALASAFGFLVWKPYQKKLSASATCILALFTLVLVWEVNFLWLLPVLNPQFPKLLPMSVTLISKLGFGLAMAWIFVKEQTQLQAEPIRE